MAAFQNAKGEDYLPGGYVRFNGVQYELTGKTRDKPVSQEFLQKLMAAVQATDPSLQVKIVSGGQSPKGSGGKRTGSTRHDVGPDGFGNTADLVLVRNGKAIRPGEDKALYSRFLQNAAAAGFPGIGHYSWGVHVGGGKQATWGPSTTSSDLDPEFRKAVAAGRQSYASGVRLPYADIPARAPTPATISPAITAKRQAYAANNGERAIQEALLKWGGVDPEDAANALGYDAPVRAQVTPANIPPTKTTPNPVRQSPTNWDAFYDQVYGVPNVNKASAAKQDRARPNVAPTYMSPSTPTQVASLYDGILPKATVAATPKLSAPGAGLSEQQRAAMSAVPPSTRPTLQPKAPTNAPGQTWGVGGANQAGTTQMPRDVRPSSVAPAPNLNPILADAVQRYSEKKSGGVVQPAAPVKLAAPGAGLTAEQRAAMSALGTPERVRVASIEPTLPAPRPVASLPSVVPPVPLSRAAGDAARANAASQNPVAAAPLPKPLPSVPAPIPLPYSAGAAARAKAASAPIPATVPRAPVTEVSAKLQPKPDAWESMLIGVDDWWQRTPAGRIGNVLAGKPQAPSRTGVPEAFMSWLDQQNNKPKAQPAPARSPGIGLTLFGGGGMFGGGNSQPRALSLWQSLLGNSMPATGPNAGPAAFTPQGNLHPGVATASNGNDMAYMPRSYQENPRNWNGGY